MIQRDTWSMIGRIIDVMNKFIIVICLTLLACPPPSYKLKFKSDGLLLDEIVITEGDEVIEITGAHQGRPSPFDRIWIEASFSIMDSLNPRLCHELIDIQSNTFKDYHPDLLKEGKMCAFDLYHYWLRKPTFEEYFSFLDTTYVRIIVHPVPEKSYIFEVEFDKDWIRKEHWKGESKAKMKKTGK